MSRLHGIVLMRPHEIEEVISAFLPRGHEFHRSNISAGIIRNYWIGALSNGKVISSYKKFDMGDSGYQTLESSDLLGREFEERAVSNIWDIVASTAGVAGPLEAILWECY